MDISVLVADGDDRTAEQAKKAFESSAVNFQTVRAHNFSEALDRLCSDKFDVVVLNLELDGGGMSLLAGVRAMRKRFSRVPIIVVADFEDEELVLLAANEGANGFVLTEHFNGVLKRAVLFAATHRINSGRVDSKFSSREGLDSLEKTLATMRGED